MKPICPLMQKACIESRCAFWAGVMGKNPQTGEHVNKEACTIQLLPMLLIENSQQQRQTGAAVESLRNEVAASAGTLVMKALGLNLPGHPTIEEETHARLSDKG